jgi:vitamin K-dependent gamma-carboxylase
MFKKLLEPVQDFTVNVFIRIYGVVLILEAASYLNKRFIEDGILAPKVHFTFDCFGWVKPVSPGLMKFSLALWFVCGLLMIFNKLRKPAMLVHFITFSYFLLLDKAYFNNHLYLQCLLALIFFFYTPKENEKGISFIPRYYLLLLQFMVVLVYFYGGLVKLNYDWMVRMEPMKSLLEDTSKNSVLPSLAGSSLMLYILNYGGVFFDIFIGPLLWWEKTQKVAIWLCLGFHGLNYFLFNFGPSGEIGMFPVLMFATSILFVDADRIRQWWVSKFGSSINKIVPANKNSSSNIGEMPSFAHHAKFILPLTVLFVVWQLLMPLRPFFFKGKTAWTNQGNYFSWRMKFAVKQGDIAFYGATSPSDSLRQINIGKLVNSAQINSMKVDPTMILQLGNYIGKELERRGAKDPVVKCRSMISLNAMPPEPIVDSTINILPLTHKMTQNDEWILPHKGSSNH